MDTMTLLMSFSKTLISMREIWMTCLSTSRKLMNS